MQYYRELQAALDAYRPAEADEGLGPVVDVAFNQGKTAALNQLADTLGLPLTTVIASASGLDRR